MARRQSDVKSIYGSTLRKARCLHKLSCESGRFVNEASEGKSRID
jgi:hypothetical protein